MQLVPEEEEFLKALVKSARQRIHQVKWVDRDGTQRLTLLSQAESAQVNAIARRQKTNPSEVLRQAAHIPVSRPAAKLANQAADPVKDPGNG